MSDILHFKLISAEEVVGEVVQNDDDGLIIKRPRCLVPQPVGPGQMSIAMMPYLVADAEGDVKFERACVAATSSSTSKELEDAYRSQTSGIQVASAGSVPESPIVQS